VMLLSHSPLLSFDLPSFRALHFRPPFRLLGLRFFPWSTNSKPGSTNNMNDPTLLRDLHGEVRVPVCNIMSRKKCASFVGGVCEREKFLFRVIDLPSNELSVNEGRGEVLESFHGRLEGCVGSTYTLTRNLENTANSTFPDQARKAWGLLVCTRRLPQAGCSN